tara:strand:+ start:1932 stop:3041 length:1110 start_codon:yes stop_codon:yes gene_type:complete
VAYYSQVKNYKYIIFATIIWFILNGTIYLGASFVSLFFYENMFAKQAMNFHMLCFFVQSLFLSLFIAFLSPIKGIVETNQINATYYPRLLFISIALFIIWAIYTKGVSIYSPRTAYQELRTGMGPVWALMVATSTMYFVASTINNKTYFFPKYLFFVLSMYFSGSKLAVVSAVLFPLFFPIISDRTRFILFPFMLIISVFAFISLFGNSFEDILKRLASYFSMFNFASMVFEDVAKGDLEHTFGQISLSGFWQYVPRSIYPDKPFGYGSNYFTELYFPGTGLKGHSISFGEFTHYYVDFGWLGVFAPLFQLYFLLKLWCIFHLIKDNKKSWKFSFSIGYLILPTFLFHLPILLGLIFFWLVNRGRLTYR